MTSATGKEALQFGSAALALRCELDRGYLFRAVILAQECLSPLVKENEQYIFLGVKVSH